MADITDAAVVTFSNETLRPLSDWLTGIFAQLVVIETRWDDHIKPLINGNVFGDVLIDGSGPTGDGRVQLTKGDLNKFMDQVKLLRTLITDGASPVQTAVGEAAYEDVMKPHVNPRFLPINTGA